MKKLFCFLLIGFHYQLGAFNYQTVYSHQTYFYQNETKIYPLKIDSVKFTSDSILYPFKNIRYQDYRCIIANGPSWIGEKIVVNKDWNYFFNKHNDTIKLKISAKLNESWEVFRNNNFVISGTVTGIDTAGFSGISDSVKTIEFKVLYRLNNASLYNPDKEVIKISKHYGLVKTPAFSHWPEFETETDSYLLPQGLQLAGLEKPKAGIKNLTWWNVHDYQVGDELHIEYSGTWPTGPPPDYYVMGIKTIKKCIERNEKTDSIIYKFEIKELEKTYENRSSHERLKNYLSTEVIIANPEFDLLSMNPFIQENQLTCMYQYSKIYQVKAQFDYFIPTDNPACWHQYFPDACVHKEYYEGLGGPYYICNLGNLFNSDSKSLVYYKKGNKQWGQPLIINNIDNPESVMKIPVYPNPVSDKLNFKLTGANYDIEIFNASGKKVISMPDAVADQTINMSMLTSGIYFYVIKQAGDVKQTGRVCKK